MKADVKIYPKFEVSDTIDFAIRFYKNDKVIRHIIIENNTEDTLFLGNVAPTFATVFAQGYGDTHFAFEKDVASSSQRILPNDKFELALAFSDNISIPKNQEVGEMAAILYIGLSKDLQKPNTLVYQDTFFLKGKTTDLFFDIYKDTISFDSVFIDTDRLITKQLFFRNNSTYDFVDIISQDFKVITSITNGQEFFPELINIPFKLASRTNPGSEPELTNIRYKPKDRGADTAFYSFTPSIEGVINDSIQSRTCLITGYGVDFNYSIINSNYQFSNFPPTIDLGDIKTNEIVNISAIIQNLSNINFTVLSATFNNDNLSGSFTNLNEYIEINDNLSINFELLVKEKGFFQSELLLETDLQNRKINGFQENKHKYIRIKLIGRGIEPRLNLPFDTLDIGSISSFGPCETKRESKIKLNNSGNYILEIKDYYINDNNFSITIDEKLINEGNFSTLNLTFQPIDIKKYGEYYATIYLITNQSKPKDTISFVVKANLIQANQVTLKIPDVKFKPGSMIKVPILLNQSNISSSDRFTAQLTYKPTLIQFSHFSTLNTSSLNSDNLTTITGEEGIKNISILMPQPNYFTNSDTLINLYFNTSIGYDKESNLILSSTKFADASCDDLLPIEFISGLVLADSIPNIDQIFYDFSNKILASVTPNPIINNFTLNLSQINLVSNKLEISIVDAFGNQINHLNFDFNSNNESIDFNTSNFQSGIYFIKIISGNSIDNIPIIVTK